MEIRQLEHFTCIAQTGTVTAAANVLHVSQPTLSQSLRRLERELETPLFDRSGRGMRLTAAGEALLGPAQRILRECDNARSRVGAVRGLSGGYIDVVTMSEMSAGPLGALIGRFRRTYPLVVVRVKEATVVEDIPAMVEDGACDVGVGLSQTRTSGVMSHVLGVQRYQIVAGPDTVPEPPSGPVRLEDTGAWPFVCGPRGSLTRHLLESSFAERGLSLRVMMETEIGDSVLSMVREGAGVALIPEEAAASVDTRGLMRIETDPVISHELSFMHRVSALSPAAKAFVNMGVQRRLLSLAGRAPQ